MLLRGTNVARIAVRLTWVAGVIAIAALVALPHLLGFVDRQLYTVRGGSMEPAIPIGSIVIVHRVGDSDVKVGDVITFRAGNGTIVTHRVIAAAGGETRSFSTKGDASQSPDPTVIDSGAVVGKVELSVPGMGALITALSSAAGMVLVMGVLGTLLLAAWFLDELAATLSAAPTRRVVAGRAA